MPAVILRNKRKIALIVAGGIVMMGGDYLYTYYDAVHLFFVGEIISLTGWTLFVLGIESNA